jgi:hypothetical protein
MNNCLVIFLFTIFIIYCIKSNNIQKGGDNHPNEIDITSKDDMIYERSVDNISDNSNKNESEEEKIKKLEEELASIKASKSWKYLSFLKKLIKKVKSFVKKYFLKFFQI